MHPIAIFNSFIIFPVFPNIAGLPPTLEIQVKSHENYGNLVRRVYHVITPH